MITPPIELYIEQLNKLTAALTAAVSISDIVNAIEISRQREILLKNLTSEKDLNQSEKRTLATVCKLMVEADRPLMDIIHKQKSDIELKLKNQVNSNKAMFRYQQNR